MREEVGYRETPQPKKCPNGEGKINSTKHTIASTLFFSICLGKLRKGRKRKKGVEGEEGGTGGRGRGSFLGGVLVTSFW